MIRKFSFAKGMFSTKISLAKGIQSKTGAAHPRQKFFVCVCVWGGGGGGGELTTCPCIWPALCCKFDSIE